LARAQNLHFESDGREIEFRDLIRQQVEPYDASGERIHLEGPTGIKLAPAVAIDMSMVVHELVTNAAKHGAMRVEGGTVKARWRSKQSDGSHVVVFDWQEKGGPPVEPPRVAGVGTKLMQAISSRSHCKLERAFEAEGLRYRFELVLDRH
jgi:two-component sensor histidine kinase